MQILTVGRRRRWRLGTHVRVGLRNRARNLFAHVGVVAFIAFVVWIMAGRPNVF